MASTALLLTGCRPAASSKQAVQEEKAAIATVPPSANKQIYPWSVVPGGVDSPSAMKQATQEDPVVAAHYAGLNPGQFRAGRLPAKRQGYVSYRIRDKIFWTRRMVTLLAGESVLTDGESMVRGRCGNLISSIPQQPVAPESSEPQESVMDAPVSSSQLEAKPPAETAKFYSPNEAGDAKNTPSVLPSPQAEEPLPPVWVAGGNTRPAVGVVGGPAGPGGPGSPSNPTSPVVTPPPINGALTLPPLHPSVPIEIPPPMVLVSLVNTSPLPHVYPPDVLVSNVIRPRPTSTGVPSSPSFYWRPPGDTPPPPGNPPPSTPPSDTAPPSPPPPGGDAPPNENPPLSDPPLGPPPSPPSDIAVPEPGVVLLLMLGLAGIAAGTSRRKT